MPLGPPAPSGTLAVLAGAKVGRCATPACRRLTSDAIPQQSHSSLTSEMKMWCAYFEQSYHLNYEAKVAISSTKANELALK